MKKALQGERCHAQLSPSHPAISPAWILLSAKKMGKVQKWTTVDLENLAFRVVFSRTIGDSLSIARQVEALWKKEDMIYKEGRRMIEERTLLRSIKDLNQHVVLT